MLRSFARALCAALLLALASPSFALVSICSGEFLPEIGAEGVRHEVLWDDFDAWFGEASLELYTRVEGAAAFEREDVYPLGQGGAALHVAPISVAGRYTVSGYARLAFPQAWGIEGGFGGACAPWSGALTQVLGTEEPDDSQSVAGKGNGGASSCAAAVADACMNESSTPPVIGGGNTDGVAPRPSANRVDPLSVAQGLLYALDATGIVLQTATGQYFTYYFTQDYAITRHTVVQVSELSAGEVISAVVERDAEGALSVASLRAYRDQPRDVAAASQTSELASDLAVSGVLKDQDIQPGKGGELRVTSGGRELILRISPLIDATVIRPAQFADIAAVPGYIRVVAVAQADGRQAVRAIELHW